MSDNDDKLNETKKLKIFGRGLNTGPGPCMGRVWKNSLRVAL